jgi:phenylalanyl-tRNA synthetase alpha chain
MTESSTASTQELERAALDSLSAAKSETELEDWRIAYLGRRGELSARLRSVGSLPPEVRREAGASLNRLKSRLTVAFDEAVQIASQAQREAASADAIDITLPGRRSNLGGLHPSEMMMREILGVFNDMGFQTVEGPIVELEKYNFDMLNVPPDHPARDLQDTLWIDRNSKDRVLLRTQTSPMQIRTMEKQDPPVRIVSPGLCFRHEATDATHEWQFHQIEGLAVDEGVTMSDLKGTLYEFTRRILGTQRKIRFRCDYFPFVEPGVDVSVEWDGQWVEIMGAGMVHPKVLEGVGYDTSKYTGFAFGMGPERIAMLRYNIEDIRHFFSNDLRFLSQF